MTKFQRLKLIFLRSSLVQEFLYRKRYRGLGFTAPLELEGKIVYSNSVSVGYHSVIRTSQGGQLLLGTDVIIMERCQIYAQQISIGNHTSLQTDCKILGHVKIGDYCIFAPNVFISSGSHHFNLDPALPIKLQDETYLRNNPNGGEPVEIHDDCWLGINTVVVPGIKIGKGSVIGANCVVTKDTYPYGIYGGVPAKLIGKRMEFKAPSRFQLSDSNLKAYLYRGYEFKNGQRTLNKDFAVAIAKNEGTCFVRITYWGNDKANFTINGQHLNVKSGETAEMAITNPELLFDFQLISLSCTEKIDDLIIELIQC
jgi:acetyltransferase-like isoleucine patch superfamily enzyme